MGKTNDESKDKANDAIEKTNEFIQMLLNI